MNKFWTGVYRESGKGLDQLKFQCCAAEYHEPLKGEVPLPDSYKGKEGRFSFKMEDGKYLRMHDNWVDLKSDKRGNWEQFQVYPVDINKGLYRVVNHQLREMACEGGNSNSLKSWSGDFRLKEFSFIPKDGGVAIYNTFTQRFVGPYNGNDAGCHEQEYQHAMVFQGISNPLDEKFRALIPPSLFRTELTAEGEGSGWGFQRSFGSKWFAFREAKFDKWLSAPSDDINGTGNEKPGAWEKFEIKMAGEKGKRTFAIKSFHGKYLSCKSSGAIRADYVGKPNLWELFIIYETSTNNIKLYNPHHNRYIRMDADGSVHCNEQNAEHATEWTTPSY